MSIYEIDTGGVERIRGTLHTEGGAPGDVPVQQANGSFVQAPGGGAMSGAQRWIGPYTVGFADFAPDTSAAEVMTPTAGDLFLGARFKITDAFDAGVILSLAAGDLADGPAVYLPGVSGGIDGLNTNTPANGASFLQGPEVGYNQDGTSKLIDYLAMTGALIESNAVDPRVFVYTNQLPTTGTALVWFSFATPQAP